jgi:hypothetical protein
VFWIFFQILEYVHIYHELSWGQDPSLNTKLIYISYTPTDGLKVTVICSMSWSMVERFTGGSFYLLYHVDIKKYQIFGAWGFGMRVIQPLAVSHLVSCGENQTI